MNGIIFDIKRYAIHDGPGIRTTVFFKGCPLRCEWCQNPESRDPTPQVSLLPGRCIRCGACLEACPSENAVEQDGVLATDRADCTHCGACADACPSGARTLLGREVSAAELIEELARDHLFYDESGGGVTFSGGEPLMQTDFLLACLAACRQRDYHTAVDTCGHAPAEMIRKVADLADLFLYDLKIMDEARHRVALGVSNRLILENLRTLCERNKAVWVRFPLVPGVNDDDANLDELGEFVATLKGPPPVQVLPYHRIGSDKYARLGVPYSMQGTAPPPGERVAEVAERLSACGLNVRIGG